MTNTPYMSEIQIMAFNFAPQGWAMCNGQLLPINQNQALFSLLGTTYGGNGQTNFALPNMRGRVAIHMDSGHNLGEAAGTDFVTITQQTMPQHLHLANISNANGAFDIPDSTAHPNAILGTATLDLYRDPTNLVPMEPAIVSSVGGSQAHENRQPFLVLNYCISLQGVFPSQN